MSLATLNREKVDFRGIASPESRPRPFSQGITVLHVSGSFANTAPAPPFRRAILAACADIGIGDWVKKAAVDNAAEFSPILRQRVILLSQLQENWDGKRGQPVKPHVLAETVDTLRNLKRFSGVFFEPSIVPLYNGFVQMEWHTQSRSLEIEAIADGWSVVGTDDLRGPRHYFDAECRKNDSDRLNRFYLWVIGNELIWPLM